VHFSRRLGGAYAFIDVVAGQSRGSGAENEGCSESNLRVGEHCRISCSVDRLNLSSAEEINEGGVLFRGIATTVRRAEQIRESQGAAAVKRLAPPRRWPNGTTSRGPFQDERMMLLFLGNRRSGEVL
jgi:hypothetical protein